MATFEPTSLTGRSVPQTWACQIFQTVLGAAPSEAALPTRCRRHAIPSANVNGRDELDRPCGPLSRRSGLQNAVALHFRRCLKSICQMVAKSHNVPPLFTAELTLGMPNFVFFASANGTASSLSPPLPPRLDEPRERGAAPGCGEKVCEFVACVIDAVDGGVWARAYPGWAWGNHGAQGGGGGGARGRLEQGLHPFLRGSPAARSLKGVLAYMLTPLRVSHAHARWVLFVNIGR